MSRSSTIVSLEARDIRFPTSRWLDGSDAMHTDPDHSAAYVVLRTDADDGLEGHGLTFTNGRGTEVVVAAARALEPLVVGRTLEGIVSDLRGFWRSLTSDSQLRWLGPEKGVIHLATGRGRQRRLGPVGEERGQAAVEAPARGPRAGADRGGASTSATSRTPSRRTRHSTCSRTHARGAAGREPRSCASGYPAYTTSAGWLGYDDEKIDALVREALEPASTT